MSERIAVIDLGSNSARLIIMHIYTNGAYNLVYHQKESLRLGEGMGRDQLLQPAAIERALAALRNCAQMCSIMKVDTILAVATAAVRNARNGPEFLDMVEKETGLPLQAISGESEARLGFLGTINTINVQDAVLFDLGGGSTEISLVKNRRMIDSISLPIGAVNLSDEFKTHDKVTKTQLAHLCGFIDRQLKKAPWLEAMSLPLVGVGGTARNIAKMDQSRKNYPFSKVHNYRMGPIALEDLFRLVTSANLVQRRRMNGLSSERGDLIVAGLSVVKRLFDRIRASHLIISGCGVREGLFFRHYLSREDLPDVIPDILEHSAMNMLRFYKVNEQHALHVTDMTLQLFDGWTSLHHLDDRDRMLLQSAALLHDIGISINYYDHTRHSAYLVENARLFGLTHREQILTAVVAGWHSSISAKMMRNRLYSEFLDEADWEKARKMSVILAVANSLDSTHRQLITNPLVSFTKGLAVVSVSTEGDCSLEMQAVEKQHKVFQREFGAELTIVFK
ncbi:MAG TPA: exopolyphosphatase [Negativicutes bacterium]|nr:exopolyphosphatase [Negativicutes bacterium]